ncbi:hypothetical protein FXV83_41290 [Bradyrhizobium hipponense]|uniref:ABM domain-containing protein n=1 Tax=Bradyrhizobium hipponense TaxID=2605638 RepID=A0A5S4Y8V9_9BRAD|nr:antibiotic biosynthesis monooxygenase [Bradyrhizobium hipponense]TYO60880.1 hypothetical protein FXV83_41290 [Bradyrhizobium hipponense]
MPKFAIFSTANFDNAEQRDKVLPVFRAHAERCLKEEPGRALDFKILKDRDDPTKSHAFELFESESSWATHHEGPSVQILRKDCAAVGYDTRSRITAIYLHVAD